MQPFPFRSANYRLMLLGIFLILGGFFLMSLDKEPFGFGTLGLTISPIVIVAGFIVEIFAILKSSIKK